MKKIIDLKYIDSYIELMTDLVFIKNLDGQYLYLNSEYLKFLDISKKEIIGQVDSSLFPRDNIKKSLDKKKLSIKKNIPIHFDDHIVYNNKIKYFHITKQKIYDINHNLIGVLCIARDITETKQYQFLYEDNNELLEYINKESNTQKILDKIVKLSEKRNPHIICSILLLDKTQNILKNGATSRLPTYYSNAIDGLKIGENIGSCGAAAFKKERVIIENINTHTNWLPYLKLTKKANLHSCWSEPILSSKNDILGTFAMYTHQPSTPSSFELKLISSYAHLTALTIEKENERIEASIKKREDLQKELNKKTEDLQLFKQIIENISYGVTVTNINNHNLLYVNKSFETITGYTKEEVIGRNCKFLQNNDTQQKAIQKIKKAIQNKEKIQIELRNYKKDGTLFYNLISIAPVYNKEQKITHLVGIQKDITEEKKQEALIAEQSKLASMGEMIGNIAHQWRQPLSIISTAATGMQLQKEYNILKDKDFQKACESINDNVQYLSQTIDDFKSFIQKDNIKTYFKLSKNINRFISLTSATAKSNDIHVILDLDDSIEINGFENELIQCFMNIFNNSKDALYNTKNKLVFIHSHIENNMVTISIKDNAGGIQEDIMAKVFEPYFTTKYKYQGTGLGLHMTYNLIVEGMNGIIEVENCTFCHQNTRCTGAEFIIKLPIR